MRATILVWAVLLALWPAPALAHLASSSYLHVDLREGHPLVQWDIALRDLDVAVGLDRDGDGRIIWGELRARQAAVAAYAAARLSIRDGAGPCSLEADPQMLADLHAGLGYAVLRWAVACRGNGPLVLDYALLFEVDPTHRGLLTVVAPGGITNEILSPDHATVTLDAPRPSLGTALWRYLTLGVSHILLGYDHLLFVAALLIPCGLARHRRGPWQPSPTPTGVPVEVLKVLTAFTLSHAITLALGVLGLVDVPATLVEPLVAVTIMLAAVDNVRAILPGSRWALAFAFGLVHGLSFAAGLGPMKLPAGDLAAALAGFNLGVEAGQVGLALLLVPIGLVLRPATAYRRVVVPLLSAAVFALAGWWFVQRIGLA